MRGSPLGNEIGIFFLNSSRRSAARPKAAFASVNDVRASARREAFCASSVASSAGEQREMAALHQHPRNLHQGLACQGMVGLCLDESVELGSRLLEQLATANQVACLGGLVDLCSPFLIIENDLQVRGQDGIGPELIDVLKCQVVEAVVAKLVEKLAEQSADLPRP